MTYRKKLIEVALPLDEINTQSSREKSIRHGHPSTLHLWWAWESFLTSHLDKSIGSGLPEERA